MKASQASGRHVGDVAEKPWSVPVCSIVATQLFTVNNNGLHFKYSDIGANAYKSLPRLEKAVSAHPRRTGAAASGKRSRYNLRRIEPMRRAA